MRWLVGLSLIFIVICTACAPIGDIGGGTADDNELLAVPHRMVYTYVAAVAPLFRRDTDLAVFTSYYNTLQMVNINDVTLQIEDPVGEEPVEIDPEVYEVGYPLRNVGRCVIIVSYEGLSDRYSIEVQNPNAPPSNNGDGNISTGTGGSNIKWDY